MNYWEILVVTSILSYASIKRITSLTIFAKKRKFWKILVVTWQQFLKYEFKNFQIGCLCDLHILKNGNEFQRADLQAKTSFIFFVFFLRLEIVNSAGDECLAW